MSRPRIQRLLATGLAVLLAATATACSSSDETYQVTARFPEAIALYEQALALDPELAIAWNGLSLAHRQKGDMDAAVEAGRRLIELEPDDPLSHTNLSILYMRQGLIPEAEEEKAIAMQLQMRAQRR